MTDQIEAALQRASFDGLPGTDTVLLALAAAFERLDR